MHLAITFAKSRDTKFFYLALRLFNQGSSQPLFPALYHFSDKLSSGIDPAFRFGNLSGLLFFIVIHIFIRFLHQPSHITVL